MDRFRDRFSMAGAKDDSRDAEVMASALRTDPSVSACLLPPIRPLSNCANGRASPGLGVERNRLANRLREQFWRYFPALLELETDLSAEWLLEFLCPSLRRRARPRACAKPTVAKLLKERRIRRLDAAHVLEALRAPPPQLAAGTIEAASAHVTSLIPRLPSNRQIREAERKLDAPTARLIPAEDPKRGRRSSMTR